MALGAPPQVFVAISDLGFKRVKDKLEVDIGQMKAVQVGSENGDKPIRVSLASAEVGNSIFWQKLPREIKIEKYLPQRYR